MKEDNGAGYIRMMDIQLDLSMEPQILMMMMMMVKDKKREGE